MITNYYYNEQIRRYLLQFCAIFSGMQVRTGKGESGTEEMISVPIHVGNKDRVVAAIVQRFNQNTMFQLPIMSAYLQSLDMAPERRKGIGVVDRRTILKEGGVFPDDIRVASRVMPIPYNMTMELAIYASNSQQMQQILEQILIIFDPSVQIQTSDAALDWTKITKVELMSINNEENYPTGNEKRMIVWTLTFEIQIWLTPPANIKDELVRQINIRIGDLKGFDITEFGADGELQPFKIIYGTTTVTENMVVNALKDQG